MFKHVPNILTMCRFALIPPIFISIINHNYVAAFIFLTLSGITDILDGAIARKFNFITNFGKLFEDFGLTLEDDLIVEADSEYYLNSQIMIMELTRISV